MTQSPNLPSRPAKRSTLSIPTPRLLPAAIGVMTLLLVLKSGSLVRATVLGHTEITPQAKAAPMVIRASASGTPPAAAVAPQTTVTSPAYSKPQAPPGLPKPDEPQLGAPVAGAIPSGGSQLASDPPVSDSERALLTDLRQRRLKLDERETALVAREATLGAVEKRLAARVDELTSLQQQLQRLEKQRQERDETNWKGLVKLYETMKPRDAATIFNDLDLPVLLPVVDRMKEAKAAAIIAVMQPERARQLTVEIANQRTRSNSIVPDPSRKPATVTPNL
jgi:flagellar motility protein MotE (MotC chaperone)